MLSPTERKLRAQIASNTRWANEDRQKSSERQRQVLLRRFQTQVDPHGVLAPAERAVRAERALRAHMARLALRAVRARRAKGGS